MMSLVFCHSRYSAASAFFPDFVIRENRARLLLSDTAHSDAIELSCSSFSSTGYKVPWLIAIRFPLVCSMRRAMPYPCSGPRTESVFKIINASVPCHTSILSFIWVSNRRLASLMLESNKKMITHDGADYGIVLFKPRSGGRV